MRNRRRAHWLLAALLLAAAPGHARKPNVSVVGDGACPEPEAIERLVLAFVPEGHVFTNEPRIEVLDRGESYDVAVIAGGERYARSYTDAERRCAERARFAAVFVVLTILPPELWPAQVAEGLSETPRVSEEPVAPPPPAPAPAEAPPPPALPSPTPPLVRFELGGFADFAPRWSNHVGVQLFGGALRSTIGRGMVRASLGLDFAPERELAAGTVAAGLTRYSGRAGVRFTAVGGSVEPFVELGAIALLQRVRGLELYRPETDSALDFGARAEAGLGWSAEWFGVFAGVHATLVPAPRSLQAEPRGEVGRLPRLWFGGSAGVSLSP